MFILATLAVIVVIGALFIGNIRQNTRDAIVLPDTAQSVQSESQPDENKPALLEVTRENVQNIVRSLHRPQYYHQTYTITRQMNGAVSETSAGTQCAAPYDYENHLETEIYYGSGRI